MDKLYKKLFLAFVRSQMEQRFPDYAAVKPAADEPLADIFAGSLLYRRPLDAGRAVWLVWSPGPGVERCFWVRIGWTVGSASLPHPGTHERRLYDATGPIPGLPGGAIDLEQLEGAAALGGITIPSPWDSLLQIKASAPAAVQRAAQALAFTQAQALTEQERAMAAGATVEVVFDRLQRQLPAFTAALEALR